MSGPHNALGYESATRPADAVVSSLLGEWFRWTSVAIALDVVPFAILWGLSQGWLRWSWFTGQVQIAIASMLGGIALVVVVRLIRLAARSRGVARACYAFLAFVNFKAGLFACGMLVLVLRL